jgi:hypothetical protein
MKYSLWCYLFGHKFFPKYARNVRIWTRTFRLLRALCINEERGENYELRNDVFIKLSTLTTANGIKRPNIPTPKSGSTGYAPDITKGFAMKS